MVIGGKIVSLAECMVKARIPDPKQTNNTRTDEYIWVGYDDSRARLPVAIAPSAQALAKIMGVSDSVVCSVWSRKQKESEHHIICEFNDYAEFPISGYCSYGERRDDE